MAFETIEEAYKAGIAKGAQKARELWEGDELDEAMENEGVTAEEIGELVAAAVKTKVGDILASQSIDPTPSGAPNMGIEEIKRIVREVSNQMRKDMGKQEPALPPVGSASELAENNVRRWRQMEERANSINSGAKPSVSSDYYSPAEMRRMMEAEQRAKQAQERLYQNRFLKARRNAKANDESPQQLAPFQATDRFGYKAGIQIRAQDTRNHEAGKARRQREIDEYRVKLGTMSAEDADAKLAQALSDANGYATTAKGERVIRDTDSIYKNRFEKAHGRSVAGESGAPGTDGAQMVKGDGTSIAHGLHG